MGQVLSICKGCDTPRGCDNCPDLHNWIVDALVEKAELQAYRDTGLEPDEVLDMVENIESRCLVWFDKNYGIGAGRMMELAEADKACQLVVLPCKVGDAAYWVHNGVITDCRVNRIQLNRAGLFICLRSKVSHGAFSARCIGKTVFLNRLEAETAVGISRKDWLPYPNAPGESEWRNN